MSVAVLIPSYRRPRILNLTLPSWLRGMGVRYLVVVADSPYEDEISFYKQVLSAMERRYGGNVKIAYELYKVRKGSINARNRLLKLANELNADFIVMADDDYILPNPRFTKIMALHLEKNQSAGAIGGRVIMVRKRTVDPDFFLNTPISMADPLTKATGFIFLDVVNGPRYAEFLTAFYMLRKDLLGHIYYDPLFESPTAYREESDIHMQIKKLGYKIILDPRVYVLHLGLEEGGNRSLMSMTQRIYWKARNHTLFIHKHFNSLSRRLWYLLLSTLFLSIYRPWNFKQVLKGVRNGLQTFYRNN